VVAILLTQAGWTSPIPPTVYRDFWKAAYQAINIKKIARGCRFRATAFD
jgi:hypothetical protein